MQFPKSNLYKLSFHNSKIETLKKKKKKKNSILDFSFQNFTKLRIVYIDKDIICAGSAGYSIVKSLKNLYIYINEK